MPLQIGEQLGSYEITSLLGKGGMGEVYRARDSKLKRDIAIKILPDEFSRDADRANRFQREAEVLASLNHPNIGAIYDLQQHADDTRFLVLELVEGETLAERIQRGPIPVEESMNIALQICEALGAAHEKGIVHRDLKPANVKITSDGKVKVLDFGLAKAMDPSASDSGGAMAPSQSPTLAPSRTGVILGTAAYMSPEQARGRNVDKRADIWAFGCILYEMLTGRLAFPGETLSDVIVSVLDRAPDWSMLPPETPPMVTRLLRRCLEKDVRRRLRDIGDARLDLDDSMSFTDGAVGTGPRPPVRDIALQRITDFEGLKEAPAVSPDGKTVAFVAIAAGKRHIWIRLRAGGTALQLTHDNVDHLHPRWAPDSSTLIYFTPGMDESEEGAIWEIGALGGWPRRIATAVCPGDISHDSRRIALLQQAEGRLALIVAARDGSPAERVMLLPIGTYTFVRWAPDDRSIAFQRLGLSAFDGHIDVVNLTTAERREITVGAWLQGFAWVPDGSGFVYGSARGSSLLYPPVFNLRAVHCDGSGDRQLTFGDHSYVEPDVHASGTVVACRIASRSDIWKFPIGGSALENVAHAIPVTRQTGQVQAPSVSPDEREIVFVSDSGGHANLWIARTDGTGARPITFETDPDIAIGVPRWSPRGDQIAFVRSEHSVAALWAVRPDGSGLRCVVRGWAPCWSPDGRWLYNRPLDGESSVIQRTPIDGGPAEVVWKGSDATTPQVPAISSDGATLFLSLSLRSSVYGMFGAGLVEYCRISLPDGRIETMARVSGKRMPSSFVCFVMSPDERYVALALIDGATTNLWILPTAVDPMRQVTDFGARSCTIARSVSWSRDSQHIYAALAETQTDVFVLDGLLAGRG